MGFTINTNTSAQNAMRNLNLNQTQQAKSVERLSSGLRINRAADDAAGLSISEGLKNQVSGLTQAGRNAQDGISLIQTAEGALTEVHNTLNRMRDLTVQAANDTNNTEARTAIKTELTALTAELTRIKEKTNFNGIQLLDNSEGGGVTAKPAGTDADGNATPAVTGVTSTLKVQVGADADDTIDVKLADVAGTLSTLGDLEVGTQAQAASATTALDAAIKSTSEQRADLGAAQNRLESASRSIAVSVENLSSANSRIRDTDMAQEMGNFTKSQILSQAATAMLAQANQMNSGVMSLLQ